MAQKWFMMALAAVAVVAFTTEAATNHVVGGSTGWTIPSSASLYSQWASAQTFTVGDTLVFNFTTGMHNVVEVPKSSYDSCSSSKQIGSTFTVGPATVSLTKSGSHYYICGVTGHCSIGQKLAIKVAPAASSSSPVPAPSAGTPAAAPAASSPSPATAAAAGTPATAPAASSPSPATAAAAGTPATAPAASSPSPAPAASAPAAATPAASASAPSAAPTAGGPAGPLGPRSGSGPSAGPTSSNPADNENPTATAGPAVGGPGTSSATSLSVASGYMRSMGIAAVLSATAAFLL